MMSKQPLVSVVIPTCSRRPILSRCLDALAAQTYPHIEVIIVDDCSTDDTPEFLSEFAANHDNMNITWFRNEPRAGANPSRNRGIDESKGEFIAFADDDCIAESDWIEQLMAGFDSDNVAAVTGRVDDPEPTNIYELTFKGTHRVHGSKDATRLVAGNMCIRRNLLMKYALDEDRAAPSDDISVSGRGDEEGLFLMLRAAGYEQRVVPDAIVLHEHYYTRKSFFRQAYKGGTASARLGYKYKLPLRIELMPLFFAWLLFPLMLVNIWLLLAPFACASLFLAAITYNEIWRKKKTLWEILITYPVLLGYYHCRLVGYVTQYIKIGLGKEAIERVDLSQFQRNP